MWHHSWRTVAIHTLHSRAHGASQLAATYMECLQSTVQSAYSYAAGDITSSIFKIILQTCVARNICCFLPMSVSKTPCSCTLQTPECLQISRYRHIHNFRAERHIRAVCIGVACKSCLRTRHQRTRTNRQRAGCKCQLAQPVPSHCLGHAGRFLEEFDNAAMSVVTSPIHARMR